MELGGSPDPVGRRDARAVRARTEARVVQALQWHGRTHSRGFRDVSFPGLSRAALAEAAGVSRPSVQAVERAFGPTVLGHQSDGEPLRLNSEGAFALGVEFATRHARVVIVDLNGQLFETRAGFETSFPFGQPPAPYMDWAAAAIERLLDEASVQRSDILGVGISRAAPVSITTGNAHVSGLPNREWRDVNVADQLEHRLVWLNGIPAMTGNDAHFSAVAEHMFGGAQDLTDFVYVKWSDGIGIGLILGGKPYRGSHGYAGAVGHLLVDGSSADPRPCRVCGRVGCLETRAGVVNLAEHLGVPESGGGRLADRLLEHVTHTHPNRTVLSEAAGLLGEAIASVVDTVDPAALLIGGWLGSSIHDHSDLLSAFREALERREMGFARGIEIRRPRLHRSAAYGAALSILTEQLVPWTQSRNQ